MVLLSASYGRAQLLYFQKQRRLCNPTRIVCSSDGARRSEKGTRKKVLAVLPEAGEYARNPGHISCVENELGLREWLEERNCEFVVTADKDGEGSEMVRNLEDTDIIISTPFHPAYVTRELIEKAPNLKLSITAGIGSDHVDLNAASDFGLTVAEVTGSNTVSTAEQAVLCILSVVRNYPVAHRQIVAGHWNLAEASSTAYDLENKCIGVVGAGAIGRLVMQRLKGFDVGGMKYFDYKRLPEDAERDLGVTFADLDEVIATADVVTVHVPLSDKTRGLFDEKRLRSMKKGAFLVNVSRGAIVDRVAIVKALDDGHIAGYAGDVWDVQPAPKDHPWRTMKNHGMTAHVAGNTVDAQARYQQGTKDILDAWLSNRPFQDNFYIVREGELAPQYK
ncbi:hypothetical protein WJX81_008585 [Elliptochloris bilobata]|uniref:Formate dehydrogenase n=1 Tax=Elliptochloris bilobata TaxID=381761 RepID=A0AAW1QX52_9CHLO